MKFQSRVGNGFLSAFSLITLVSISVIFIKPTWVMVMLMLITPALLIWMLLDTSYTLHNRSLYYRSAFLTGSVSIDEIREVVVGKTLRIGIKPALATKGIIVKYRRFDEIYISPKYNERFVEALLKIKPDLKITN